MQRKILALGSIALALTMVLAPTALAADPDPLADLALLATSCSPLILPPASTAEEVARNDKAAIAYRAIRDVLNPTAIGRTCTGVEVLDSNEDAVAVAPGDSAALFAAPAPKTCGDCPSCLSAASCSNICVGGVCSPPGAVPTRACRVVSSCSDFWGNVTYCCGCS